MALGLNEQLVKLIAYFSREKLKKDELVAIGGGPLWLKSAVFTKITK